MNRRMLPVRQMNETDPIADGVVLALWKSGLDSLSIARHMQVHEYEIANRLLHIREVAR